MPTHKDMLLEKHVFENVNYVTHILFINMINLKKTKFKNDNDLLKAFMSREYNNIYFVTENVSTQKSMMFEFVP